MKLFTALLVSGFMIVPFIGHAFTTTSLNFGGYVIGEIPCTCPDSLGLAIEYAPLFLPYYGQFPVTGNLYFTFGTPLYAWFVPFGPIIPGTPSTWNLGAYSPGTGDCRQPDPKVVAAIAAGNPEAGDPCHPGILIPTNGTIQYMGTSLPGPLHFAF